MEVIVWIIATIVWAVAYAIAEIRLNNLKSKRQNREKNSRGAWL